MKNNSFNYIFYLAKLTAIGISIFYLDAAHPVPTFAQETSKVISQNIQQNFSQFCKHISASRLFARTELFFGLGKPDGSKVTNLEFQNFLAREVTPKFPDGLTLLSGRGQFKNASGKIIRESSNLLILIYPLDRLSHDNQKIERIRNAYKLEFKQESVLRSDEPACVSF